MKKIYRLILFLIVSLNLSGQNTKYDFRNYQVEDGLLSRNVEAICQDKNGFIWITSGKTIMRYDGIKFSSLDFDTIFSTLHKNNITGLFCDSHNNLWIAGSVLVCYKQDAREFLYLRNDSTDPSSLGNDVAHTIYEDRLGYIWIGHWGGASRYDYKTGRFKNYRFKENLFRTICQDSLGNLWFGTFTKGAYKLNPTTDSVTHYPYEPSNSKSVGSNNIKDILCDKAGRIWLASWGGGLKLYDPVNDNFITYSLASSGYPSQINQVDAICIDSQNNFWVGTDVGLFLFDTLTKEFSPVRTMLTEKQHNATMVSNSIYSDKADGIWVCNMDGVLYFNLLGSNFRNHLYHENNTKDLSSNNIENIYVGHNNTLYLVQPKVVDVWDRNKGIVEKKSDQTILYQDSQKRLWVKKENEIQISEPFQAFHPLIYIPFNKNGDFSLLSGNIINITIDTSNNYYVLYEDKTYISKINLNTKKIEHFRIETFTTNNWYRKDIRHIDIDAYNNLWLQYWGVLIKYNLNTKKVKEYYTEKYGIAAFYSIAFTDSNKEYWLISDLMLQKYDITKDSFKIYQPIRKESGSILKVIEDANGIFWLSSNIGLMNFNKFSGIFNKYTVNDGLASNKFNHGGILLNDEIILSHEKGLTLFYPSQIKKNNNISPVVITQFKVFNKPFDLPTNIVYTKEIILNYKQNVFSFEFAILNYYNPEKNQYAYKMDGFETEWNYCGSVNVANYTNLDPGTYTFRVKGANNDGVWNETGASIKIVITPPFWQTWWFRIMVLIILIASIILVFRLRLSVIKRQKKVLEKQVEERTAEIRAQAEELKILNSTKDKFFSIIGHDLKNPFYAIHGLASILKENNTKMPAEQRLEISTMIEESSKNASSLLENLLTWARSQSNKISFNPESFSIAKVVAECISLLRVNAEKKNIALISEIPDDVFVFADRNMITTIIRNLINNALKFTDEQGVITLRHSNEGAFCTISVSDTGVGMDIATMSKLFRIDENISTKGTSGESGTGLGLIICKEFIDKNNGNITVNSELGKGSTFIIRIPVGKETIHKDWEIVNQNMIIKKATQEIVQESEIDKFEEEELKKFLQTIKRDDHTILIIEDNDEIRMNIRQNLNQYFTIEEVDNGKSGISKAYETIPDLIICDVMMPGIDGFEVCATLKADIRTSHIPIILLTARSSEKSKITGMNMGADDFINKPFNPRLLIARIKNLIIQRKLLRERFSKDFVVQPTNMLISSEEGVFLKKAIDVIEQNIDNIKYSVEDYSKDMGMSYIQLYRKLEAITNHSPVQFIRSIRLKRAAQLLENSSMNINEIALMVGFNDSSYFSKCFNEQFGILPKKYAQKKK